MRFFTIQSDEKGTKKILYPFTAIAKISADLNPDFSSDDTKITLNNGKVMNVCESIDKIEELLNDNSLKDDDFVLTAYRPRREKLIHNS